ncbi:isoaspartyl peptidase/L-asparaginase-like [Xenia sp. Carnegie-2017]|uniref:isoaspartyl peptidase/L-asparaginase-like n=1 Tax=Xenia sp. Carnegie-2017 TaxID=2897299 RepID=UPI001F034D9F|nr:isoaspartyl peptidase/L-asparaginase-like [Xenia sp. Carnegie-2017]
MNRFAAQYRIQLEPSYTPDGYFSPAIIVQGGGYSNKGRETLSCEEYRNKLNDSAIAGYNILKYNGTAVDAVEKAVSALEDCELFLAGYGSPLNKEMEVECDAMIMDGSTLETGAVISGRHFKNPVCLSRQIMEKTPHCALNGDGALNFAIGNNLPCCEPKDLRTPNYRFDPFVFEEFVKTGYRFHGEPRDSVCAVAIDSKGRLASALSSGGIWGKMKGRVGDVPFVGCGGYANDKGAAATTGHGEKLIKLTLARQVVFDMEAGRNAQEAAENAVNLLETRLSGHGGVISIDCNGNIGKAFNTDLMAWASIKHNVLEGGLEKNE